MIKSDFLNVCKEFQDICVTAFPDFEIKAIKANYTKVKWKFQSKRNKAIFYLLLSSDWELLMYKGVKSSKGKFRRDILNHSKLIKEITIPTCFAYVNVCVERVRAMGSGEPIPRKLNVLEFDFSGMTSFKPQTVLVKGNGELVEATFWKGFHYYVRVGIVTYEIPVDEFELGYFYLIYTANEVYSNKGGKFYVRSTKSLFKGQQPPY